MNPFVGTVFIETVMIRDVRKFSIPLLLLRIEVGAILNQ